MSKRAKTNPEELAVIVVIEDHDQLRKAITRAMCSLDCVVVDEPSGESALEDGVVELADLVIVDIGLPGMSGLEIVARLKEARGADLPVIVVSGDTSPADRLRAFDAGADDFVAKPLHMPELIRRVSAFLRLYAAYREAREARDRAEQVNLYASEAAALLAHDLSNGLAISLGNLQYIAEVATFTDDDQRDAADSTIRALKKMAGLVNNFVELRQLEDAAVVPKPEPTGICELIHDVASLHRHEAEARNARVMVDCPADLRAVVDPVLMERVVHNLMGNAIRYVSEGGTVRARASLADDGATLMVSIGNNGRPIDPAVQATIFEKYVTSGDRKTRRGMGLYFCRLASEAHGGTIGIEPVPDYPATFVVRVPAQASSMTLADDKRRAS